MHGGLQVFLPVCGNQHSTRTHKIAKTHQSLSVGSINGAFVCLDWCVNNTSVRLKIE